MITKKRLVVFSLIGLAWMSQKDTLVRASVDTIERTERKPSHFMNTSAEFYKDPSSMHQGLAYQAPSPAQVLTADQQKEAADKISQFEVSFTERFPNQRESVKRWLALAITDVNVADRKDLNQTDALAEVMTDPSGAALELTSLLDSSTGLSAQERLTVIRLSNDLAANELSLPLVERMLLSEVQRAPSESTESAEDLDRRVKLTTESYFRHVTDGELRSQFLSAAKFAHPGDKMATMLDQNFGVLLGQTPIPTMAPEGSTEQGAVSAPISPEQTQAPVLTNEQAPQPEVDPAAAHAAGAVTQNLPPEGAQLAHALQLSAAPQPEPTAGYDGGYDPPAETVTSNFAQ